jgi:hypothetical protein
VIDFLSTASKLTFVEEAAYELDVASGRSSPGITSEFCIHHQPKWRGERATLCSHGCKGDCAFSIEDWTISERQALNQLGLGAGIRSFGSEV